MTFLTPNMAKKGFRVVRSIAICCLLTVLADCGGSSNYASVNLSGKVSGLTEDGLSLSNGTSSLTIYANATAFVFPARVLIGSPYQVLVASLPPNLACTITNGSGVASNNSDINNLEINCVARNNLGGVISGLATDGLVLTNGGDTVRPAAGAQSFVFPTKVGQGFSYGVTVLQQPTGQICNVVANASGIMSLVEINNVQVVCQ